MLDKLNRASLAKLGAGSLSIVKCVSADRRSSNNRRGRNYFGALSNVWFSFRSFKRGFSKRELSKPRFSERARSRSRCKVQDWMKVCLTNRRIQFSAGVPEVVYNSSSARETHASPQRVRTTLRRIKHRLHQGCSVLCKRNVKLLPPLLALRS